MNAIWATITAWLKSKGGFTHIIVVAYLAAITLYSAVPAFTTLCNTVYAYFPPWAHEILLAMFGVFAFYKSTSSPAGVIATAQVLLASPDVPTRDQVKAATVNPAVPSVPIPLPAPPKETK